MADSQDRNLPASAKKLGKARSEGQVARSRDLSHFAALAAGLALLFGFARKLAALLIDALSKGLHFDAKMLAEPGAMEQRLSQGVALLLWVALPVGILVMLVGAASAVLSGGWVWSWKAMSPQFNRMDPVAGLGRLLAPTALLNTLKSVLLAVALGVVGWLYFRAQFDGFASLLGLSLPAALGHTAHALTIGLGLLVLTLAGFALVDVPLQRFLHLKRLRMSHQEVKQEHKDAEGNVEAKGRIRARMRAILRRRMLAAVPKADLVVMNPTHYAVALKYDEATMAAPRVVAKGADLLALRIRDIARDAHVPVLDAPPLARALYAHAEVDHEIPARLFGAVAQVLAYVYQLRAAMAGRGTAPSAVPVVSVPDDLDPHHPSAQRPRRRPAG